MKYSVSAVAWAMIISLAAMRSLDAQTDSSSRVEHSSSATMLRVGRAAAALKLDGASESAVVKVLRDADALYILVHAYAGTVLAVVVVAVAITLPLHYVYGLATMGHLGSLYVAVALFIAGSLITLRTPRNL
jgi:hypothetical protein